MKVFLALICVIISILQAAGQQPIPIPEPQQIHIEGGRKAVGISTDVVTVAVPIAAAAATLFLKDWQGLKEGALTAAATIGASAILKFSVSELRPDRSNYHSFPSGHTAAMFAAATFLQCRYGWQFGVPAYMLAAYVGFGRVCARKHFWWDSVAGAAIGTVSALVFTTKFARTHNVTISTGVLQSDCLSEPYDLSLRHATPVITTSFTF